MKKEEFIGKLQMCYFGEKNAFDEIVSEFDRLNNIINELEEFLQSEYKNYSEQDVDSEVGLILDKLKELRVMSK